MNSDIKSKYSTGNMENYSHTTKDSNQTIYPGKKWSYKSKILFIAIVTLISISFLMNEFTSYTQSQNVVGVIAVSLLAIILFYNFYKSLK